MPLTKTETLAIEHKHGMLDGTFADTVVFMIENLLQDGQPIEVKLSGVKYNPDGEFYNLEEIIVAIEGGALVTNNGDRVDIEDLVKVEVS